MKYVVLITPNETVEMKEYYNYKSINDLVEGTYQPCGILSIGNIMVTVYCNEEFLLLKELSFNAIATAFSDQPIYGNVVLLKLGLNSDHEKDALPLDEVEAKQICNAVKEYKTLFSPILQTLHEHYDNNKPKPSAQIITMSADAFREICEDETDNRKT